MKDDWQARQRLSDRVATEYMRPWAKQFPKRPPPRCPKCEKRCAQTERQIGESDEWGWYSDCCRVLMAD